MAFTPVEIRHVRLGRGVAGYKRHPVDRLLAEVADSFETVWRERADLAEKVERLEEDLVRYRELDQLLRTTLVSAERAAHEVKDQAQREADTILGEARVEARDITRRAEAERDLLLADARRIRALLRAALEAFPEESPPGQAQPEPEHRPGDTKEHLLEGFAEQDRAA
jgi:cell division initiation protein